MTKTQRELLILAGILVVIVAVLLLRTGGGDDTQPVPVASVPPAGQRVTPGTDDPQTLLITQAPMEMLNPMLVDSAVTARIAAGAIRDPFASDRRTGSRAPTRQPTRQTDPVRRAPTMREHHLESWPEGITYQALLPRVDAPGEYSVQFNGQSVRTGEIIPGTRWNNIAGTEWVLREASRLVIVIRREVHTSTRWEITWYRHVRMQSMEEDR